MKPRLAGLLLAASLVLAACYESDALLLDPAQAAAPLAVGRQIIEGGRFKEPLDVTLDPDHWYRITDGEGKVQRVLFTPLARGAGERRYAFAEAEADAFVYGVAYRRGGKLYFDTPTCKGAARTAAVRRGAVASGTGKLGSVCKFKDAAALVAALKDYAGRRNRGGDLTRLAAAPE